MKLKPKKYITEPFPYKQTVEWEDEAGNLYQLNKLSVDYLNGIESWWVEGKLSRLDGPAIKWRDGSEAWYIEGIEYTEQEFNDKIKQLQSSWEGKIIGINGKKYKLTSIFN